MSVFSPLLRNTAICCIIFIRPGNNNQTGQRGETDGLERERLEEEGLYVEGDIGEGGSEETVLTNFI